MLALHMPGEIVLAPELFRTPVMGALEVALVEMHRLDVHFEVMRACKLCRRS